MAGVTISRQLWVVALLLTACEDVEHPPALGDGGDSDSIPPAVLIGDDASGSGARSGSSGSSSGDGAAGATAGTASGGVTSFAGSGGSAGSAGLGGRAGASSSGGNNTASAGTFSTGGV